jgi:hypothetical protein
VIWYLRPVAFIVPDERIKTEKKHYHRVLSGDKLFQAYGLYLIKSEYL